MLHRQRTRLAHEDGFSLVELLVVVLIIGVLATIALPMFLGQRERAQDAAAKSDAANLARQMELCATAAGTYAGCEAALASASTGLAIGAAPGQVRVDGAPTATGYVVVARSESGAGTRTYTIEREASGMTRTCAPAGAGCTGSSW